MYENEILRAQIQFALRYLDSIWRSALDFVDKINAFGGAKIQKDEKKGNGESGHSDLVVSIAEKIMHSYSIATMSDTAEIYYYDAHNGVYVQGGKVLIETKAEESQNRISTYRVDEIINKIKRRTYKSRTVFDRDSNLLNLRNGLLNVMTGQLLRTIQNISRWYSSHSTMTQKPSVLTFLDS
jgi:hypothetical protein